MKQKCSVLLAIICVVLTGCSGGEEAAAMEVAERFLQECFTLNQDGRYDVMEQKLSEVTPQTENQGLQTLPEEITQRYYAPLAEMTTAVCLEDMAAN